MIYFTSDLHLGHRAVIDFQNRPFIDVEEMNETLIKNINSRVKQEDTLYILGDLTHKCRVDEANNLISKINGKKYLIKGNHDKQYDESLFEGIYDFLQVHFNGVHISLMHYPMMHWPRSHYGSLHLHGHMHNGPEYNLEQRENGIYRYDVGVDANNYMPVSFEEIIKFFLEVEKDEQK